MVPSPEEIQQELDRLRQENETLKKRLERHEPSPSSRSPQQLSILPREFDAGNGVEPMPVTSRSPNQDKIALFRRLFRGREDVYAERWESEYSGKKGYSPACENKWQARNTKEKKKYLPLTNQVGFSAKRWRSGPKWIWPVMIGFSRARISHQKGTSAI